MLPIVEQSSGEWMSLHVNISRLRRQQSAGESLSHATLVRMHAASVELAHTLVESGLSRFQGKILVFEDTDILVIFESRHDSASAAVLKTVRQAFARHDLIHILTVEEMKATLAELITLSREKTRSAEDYRMKKRAREVVENLELAQAPDPDLAQAVAKKRGTHASTRVLIIEDDRVTRAMVVSALERDYDVAQAKDARSGIISYIEHAPHVVFLDIHMPDLDGRDALRHLRRIDPKAYIVMLSGDSSTDNVRSTHAEGAAGFVRKPFSKEKLQAYIGKCPLVGSATG